MKKFVLILNLTFLGFFLTSCFKAPNYPQIKLGEPKEDTRLPVAASSYYPEKKEELEAQINKFLGQVSYYPPIEKRLKILIVPHAGLEYSGQVAAWGFKQIKNKPYKNVILIGSSHQVSFQNAAIYNNGYWQTPLGKIEVNFELAQKLTSQSNEIKPNLDVHSKEHSLEIELPFLQMLLPDFKIVPILLGQTTPQVRELIAQTIAENITDDTLLVISSDLSHYPPYKEAKKIDEITIGGILTGSVQDLESSISAAVAQKIPNLETCACGLDAIETGLLVAKKIKSDDIRLLKYQNSGDIKPSQKDKVVGYTAVGFYEGKPSFLDINTPLDNNQKKELLKIARQTLEIFFEKQEILDNKIDDESLNQKQGVFVTLKKDDNLRGCIGTFNQDTPIYKNVQEMAVSAATKDSRFPPVKSEELKDIQIEISILSIPQKISDWHEIELGRDGVIIKKDSRQGTFLPQVAETLPKKEEFLSELCSQKIGLSTNCYQDKDVEIFTYTAQVFEEEKGKEH
jgi:AmmeMemoRadiSam system protein B/AmmeMemoRadiSam system protein A